MKKTGLAILLTSFMVVGCANNPVQENTVPDMHTAEIALDWNGTYEGIFPCASCEGIKMKLELLPNKTYKLIQEYITNRPGDKVFETSGKFEFDKTSPSLIRLDDNAENSVYFVGEGYIEARDRQTGQPMSTKLNYKLNKK
ncbi:copper resistance protein NlpE N-terminal domain-containing protein [Advenella sp. WQ 585]|uniref:Copper resistance protein NlpE N-terminal domain-containing protein n=1 Tax=Advenella mandrilli TaxID=2800330 RepID=A0ABS1E8S6_9BURK|nr:copper resistance protein NlpE [Advenella mandrilli]MBK1780082.1 copper resistance protein NlpE N-terminal domain-containing protein [Advenella mandrilli]